MDRIKRPSILEANILYLFLGILLWVVGSFVQSIEVYSGLLITEYLLILMPNLIYLKLMGFSLKKVLRLNKINLEQIKYITLITIFSYPIAIFFNFIATIILSIFGNGLPEQVPLPGNSLMYFFSLFVIALAPGICEEIMFRGTIMSAYGRFGRKKSIIYSAILFGVFHLNFQNLLGPIFLGIILGITVYKTNSIYASILGHTLNNGIAMTIGYFSNKSLQGMEEAAPVAFEIPNFIQIIILIFVLAALAAISLIILKRLLKKLPGSKEILVDEIVDEIVKYEAGAIDFLPLVGIFILFMIINIKFFFL